MIAGKGAPEKEGIKVTGLLFQRRGRNTRWNCDWSSDVCSSDLGVGALPLNYPNEYDKRLGRTGSGIWLHGVPSDSYARSPNSTDGCVVLANPELQTILDQVQP